MFRLIGNLVESAARAVLPKLRFLGKGQATGAGIVAVATGVATSLVGAPLIGGVITSQNVVEVIKAVGDVLVALGTVIAAFGFGRKAGAA